MQRFKESELYSLRQKFVTVMLHESVNYKIV